jgi:hypothetical protein
MRDVALALTCVHLQLPFGSFGADYSAGKGRAQVVQLLDKASGDGMNFVRIWAFTVTCVPLCSPSAAMLLISRNNSPQFPLQLAPSVYDEGIFRGLDFVLDEAMKRNMFVVLVLADWW